MRGAIWSGGAVAAVAMLALAYGVASGDTTHDVKPVLSGTYAGEALCVRCHFKHTRLWKSTAHVGALEKVPVRYKADAACIGCHATGAGESGGFKTLESTPKLAGVQCEACHGPGADHAAYGAAHDNQLDQDAVVKTLHGYFPTDVRLSCVKCHAVEAHREHPEFEKEAKK